MGNASSAQGPRVADEPESAACVPSSPLEDDDEDIFDRILGPQSMDSSDLDADHTPHQLPAPPLGGSDLQQVARSLQQYAGIRASHGIEGLEVSITALPSLVRLTIAHDAASGGLHATALFPYRPGSAEAILRHSFASNLASSLGIGSMDGSSVVRVRLIILDSSHAHIMARISGYLSELSRIAEVLIS